MSQTESIQRPLQHEAAFESLSCDSEVANRKPAEQTHSSYVEPWQGTRHQFYCIAVFAHSRRV